MKWKGVMACDFSSVAMFWIMLCFGLHSMTCIKCVLSNHSCFSQTYCDASADKCRRYFQLLFQFYFSHPLSHRQKTLLKDMAVWENCCAISALQVYCPHIKGSPLFAFPWFPFACLLPELLSVYIGSSNPDSGFQSRGGRYCICQKYEYFFEWSIWFSFEWIFLILFWMSKLFECIFSPYNWMNYWMNQKSALFIWKMNKKCLFWTERTPFACFSLFSQAVICFPIWMNNFIEWIFLIQFWMNNFIEWIFSIPFWIEYWIESVFGPIQCKNW